MPQMVNMGSQMQCSFGAAPASLVLAPANRVNGSYMPMANIADSKPLVNIPPFGMCTSLANPTVAAATSAALGVLTPMPCVPATSAPWTPGAATTMIAGMPALTDASMCTCNWGGVITFTSSGATTQSAT